MSTIIELTKDQTLKLLDRLEDEGTPYSLRIRNSRNGIKTITIFHNSDSEEYFKNIINSVKQ